MKQFITTFMILITSLVAYKGIAQRVALARPSEVQYTWHEQERIMFIHFGVATWLGSEYDEAGKFDLTRINPTQLNTDDWCETAKSWGAKQIIFVAKHVGGFCWWQTNTTDYSVKNIPWKNGKGDLLADIAASCKKYGLNLGVYIYPGDVKYGAGLGSGGKTANPDLQEAYNKVFRQQLTEVLTRYGHMLEVWFDGNCIIDIDDILDRYASHSVIFQSKKASIRWPGSESGMLAYPAWNTLTSKDLTSGIATQYNDDPNGDAWAPLEADAPLYNHNWFWNPNNEKKRKSLQNLIDIYYKSAGYGGVMLLNASPDTTGRITEGDKNVYRGLGKEIERRFSNPVAELKNQKGSVFTITFNKPTPINHAVLEEDYRLGHRIRKYTLLGKVNDRWEVIVKGSSVGRKKIDAFATQNVTALKISIDSFVQVPLLKALKLYNVSDYQHYPSPTENNEWEVCGTWDTKTFKNNKDTITLNLNRFITMPGQYELVFLADVAVTGTSIDSAVIRFDQQNTMQSYLTTQNSQTFYINRTSQVSENSSSTLTFFMRSDNNVFQNRGVFKIRKRPSTSVVR